MFLVKYASLRSSLAKQFNPLHFFNLQTFPKCSNFAQLKHSLGLMRELYDCMIKTVFRHEIPTFLLSE